MNISEILHYYTFAYFTNFTFVFQGHLRADLVLLQRLPLGEKRMMRNPLSLLIRICLLYPEARAT